MPCRRLGSELRIEQNSALLLCNVWQSVVGRRGELGVSVAGASPGPAPMEAKQEPSVTSAPAKAASLQSQACGALARAVEDGTLQQALLQSTPGGASASLRQRCGELIVNASVDGKLDAALAEAVVSSACAAFGRHRRKGYQATLLRCNCGHVVRSELRARSGGAFSVRVSQASMILAVA